jgi:hypothetical protein
MYVCMYVCIRAFVPTCTCVFSSTLDFSTKSNASYLLVPPRMCAASLQVELVHTVFLHQTMQHNWNTKLQRFIDAHPRTKEGLLQDPTALGLKVYQLHPEDAQALQMSVNALKKFDGQQTQINRAKALFERMTQPVDKCDRVGGQGSEVVYVAGSTRVRDHEAERLRSRYRFERARQRSRIQQRVTAGTLPRVLMSLSLSIKFSSCSSPSSVHAYVIVLLSCLVFMNVSSPVSCGVHRTF